MTKQDNDDFMDEAIENQNQSTTVLEEASDQDESYEDTESSGTLTDDTLKAINKPFERKRSYPIPKSEIYKD